MKLILRQYLGDLREREELDAILPALLSEIGFTVISKPGRGIRQMGVDVAAVGPDHDDGGQRKLFLFTIKSGDIRRRDWDSGPQAVRQSLNEIQDSYIPHRVAEQYQGLPIAICICMGGDLGEDVQNLWTGYVNGRSNDHICFRMWNGDVLADHLSLGVLRGQLVGKDVRADLERSVAMAGYPDVSFRFFRNLADALMAGSMEESDGIARLRQVYVSLSVLFVWARSGGNLEAPYLASEYAVIRMWGYCRRSAENSSALDDAAIDVLEQTITLHLAIGDELLLGKVAPHASRPFALSAAVRTQSAVDVNLALFDMLGRMSLAGLWRHCQIVNAESRQTSEEVGEKDERKIVEALIEKRNCFLNTAITMVNSNPALQSPMRDDHAIEIALFMLFAQVCDSAKNVQWYLCMVAFRVMFSIKRRSAYPIAATEYHELVSHPAARSEEYFKENTKGSVLYPLLVALLDKLKETGIRKELVSFIEENLSHTTQQIWVPDEDTDERLWEGRTDHGVGITGLPLSEGPGRYAEFLVRVASEHTSLDDLSTMKQGFWPILLMACRHLRMPVPSQLWFTES